MLKSKPCRAVFQALSILAFFCCSGSAPAQTAKGLLALCDGDEKARTLCKMYLAGVVDGMTMQAEVAKRRPIACVPKDGTEDTERFRRIFVRYVEDNPHLKDQSHRVTVLAALAKVFPCKP